MQGWLKGYPDRMKQGTASTDVGVRTSVLQFMDMRGSSSSGADQRGATAAAAPSATSPVLLVPDSVEAQEDEADDSEAGSVAIGFADDEDAGSYVGGTPYSQQAWHPNSCSQGSLSQPTTDDGASSISMRVQSSVTANTSPASSQSSVAY